MAELYHLGVDVEAVPSQVLLVGPDFPLTDLLSRWDAVSLVARREYSSHLVERSGRRILVVRVGVGAPPLAIALEELSRAGASTFILVGTATGMSAPELPLVPTGAVRGEGTSDQYAPIAYPAVPDAPLRARLGRQLGSSGVAAGLVRSVDVVEPTDQHPLVAATDMLCACLFVVAAARQVRAAAAVVDTAAPPAMTSAVAEAALQTLVTDRLDEGGRLS
ncbi:MAG: uridine phosphorylase [Blastococcus sp.]|nr:uridine phosphorylase [Blastococcus sp.]